MSLIVPNVGEVAGLYSLLGLTGKFVPPFSLRLFSNNVTPTKDSVAGDFTLVTGGGYAAISLPAASWVVTAGSPSQMAYALQVITFTGATGAPGTVYGYIIVDANNVLAAAERVPSPPFTPAANSVLVIVPIITLGSVNSD